MDVDRAEQRDGVAADVALHTDYPRQFARDDFWRQIKRTVGGEPVGESDISAIIGRIRQGLKLDDRQILLDLGCGNAALGARLHGSVAQYVGVDLSPYLVGVAREFFGVPHVTYVVDDALNHARTTADTSATRVLMYGVVGYLPRPSVPDLLAVLATRFSALERIFIGNVPDVRAAAGFFGRRGLEPGDLDDPSSQIGVWWHPDELAELAPGFDAVVTRMPSDFYGATYRFDVEYHRAQP
jgi:SAM-dependent methyltransferase